MGAAGKPETSQPATHSKHTKYINSCSNRQNKLVRLIALQYAARKCKQNKRYHTSARLTLTYNRKPKFFLFWMFARKTVVM